MIPGGKLTGIWGRKRLCIVGLSLYGVGAVTSAVAPNLFVLILGSSILEPEWLPQEKIRPDPQWVTQGSRGVEPAWGAVLGLYSICARRGLGVPGEAAVRHTARHAGD